MIDLPDVTLCAIETREHDLMRLAIEDCKGKATFGDVLIFTNKTEQFADEGRIIEVPDWPEKIGWSRCRWQEIAPHLVTSHVLCIEWDAWIWDASKWTDEYLQYDYVGAPWWYEDFRNVGNGGFSMRSTALTRYLRKHRDKFPCTTPIDDDLLCRKYRPALEEKGFTWAPQDVARDFAFECVRPQPDSGHFGFHGMFNWHIVLDEEQLMQRAEIASHSNYIKKNERMWGAFCKNNPKIAQAFMPHGEPVSFDLHNEIAHHP